MHVAEALQAVLPDQLEVTLWPDVFNVGEYAADDLREAARAHDFAIFVFAPDDEVTSRGTTQQAPRDNVIFELGLFSASLGPRSTYVLKAAEPSVKVPSDLAGVGYATYIPPDAQASDSRWESAVRSGARKIRRAIDRAQAVKAAQDATGTTGQSPASLLASDLGAAARDGSLAALSSVSLGTFVVHPLLGVGQVIGFDPAGTPHRTVRVRLEHGVAVLMLEELFAIPAESASVVPRG
jgi:predicted nucleotide-binding protein